MAITEYQCLNCTKKHAVEKDSNGRLKRVNVDPNFDNLQDPTTLYRCSFCSSELIPHTIKETNKITENQTAKALQAIRVAKANLNNDKNDAEVLTALGLLYITVGGYTDAIKTLEKAKEEDSYNPTVYFYLAIAMLKGKIARLASRSDIALMSENLNCAIEYEADEDKKALYRCLYLYIQYDYFESRRLIAEPCCDELLPLIKSSDITEDEIKELFKLLKVSKPVILQ